MICRSTALPPYLTSPDPPRPPVLIFSSVKLWLERSGESTVLDLLVPLGGLDISFNLTPESNARAGLPIHLFDQLRPLEYLRERLTRTQRSVSPLELLARGKVLSLGVYAFVVVDIVLL